MGSEAKIDYLNVAVVVGEDNIPGFQVAMQIAKLVDMTYARYELVEVTSCRLFRKWTMSDEMIEKFTSVKCF